MIDFLFHSAYKYPIYGTQWHPEKNPFQWTDDNIPHDIDAVRVAQHMANFFVEEGKMITISGCKIKI